MVAYDLGKDAAVFVACGGSGSRASTVVVGWRLPAVAPLTPPAPSVTVDR